MRSKISIISLVAALFCSFLHDAYACGGIECRAKDYLLYRVHDPSTPIYYKPVIEQLQESDDPEVIEYLKIARTCEAMRTKMNSQWYYPSKEDPIVSALDDVLHKSMSYKGSKLKDRYALQAARAMFSLGYFERCAFGGMKSRKVSLLVPYASIS